MPDRFDTYYEPFFGAGALYFAIRPTRAVISDVNAQLMASYQTIRNASDDVASRLHALPRDRDSYYRIRGEHPSDPVDRAVRFVYLTTLAFNGIYRVNRRGDFNVPYGGREYPTLGSPGSLTAYAEALSTADIRAADFEQVLAGAGASDFVYLDPPYTVTHSNNGFTRYNETLFSRNDQERLASVATDLDRRGCVVVISNAEHPTIRRLYHNFRPIAISRHSRMAASIDHRRNTGELILTNVG